MVQIINNVKFYFISCCRYHQSRYDKMNLKTLLLVYTLNTICCSGYTHQRSKQDSRTIKFLSNCGVRWPLSRWTEFHVITEITICKRRKSQIHNRQCTTLMYFYITHKLKINAHTFSYKIYIFGNFTSFCRTNFPTINIHCICVCFKHCRAIFCHRYKNCSSLFLGSVTKCALFVTFLLYLDCLRVF